MQKISYILEVCIPCSPLSFKGVYKILAINFQSGHNMHRCLESVLLKLHFYYCLFSCTLLWTSIFKFKFGKVSFFRKFGFGEVLFLFVILRKIFFCSKQFWRNSFLKYLKQFWGCSFLKYLKPFWGSSFLKYLKQFWGSSFLKVWFSFEFWVIAATSTCWSPHRDGSLQHSKTSPTKINGT